MLTVQLKSVPHSINWQKATSYCTFPALQATATPKLTLKFHLHFANRICFSVFVRTQVLSMDVENKIQSCSLLATHL